MRCLGASVQQEAHQARFEQYDDTCEAIMDKIAGKAEAYAHRCEHDI